MSVLNEHFSRYRLWLMQQPLSPQSRRTYLYRVEHFLDFAASLQTTDLAALVEQYRAFLQVGTLAKTSTINNTLAAINHFCRFVDAEAPKIERIRICQIAPRCLSPDDQTKLQQAIAFCPSERDRAI